MREGERVTIVHLVAGFRVLSSLREVFVTVKGLGVYSRTP